MGINQAIGSETGFLQQLDGWMWKIVFKMTYNLSSGTFNLTVIDRLKCRGVSWLHFAIQV